MKLFAPVIINIDCNEIEKGHIGVISKIIHEPYVEVLIYKPRNYYIDEYDFIEK